MKKVYFYYFLAFAVVVLFLSFFNSIFLAFSLLILLLPIFYAFGKAIECVVLTKDISVKDLREGDWILNSIKVKGKTINSSWEGLQKEDLVLLRKLNKNKKVKVKEGIPFVPAFLIAFLIYIFRDYIIYSFFPF